MSEGSSSYSVKQAALRDLITLALYHRGGMLHDDTGHVSSRLREACGLPDTKPVGACVSATLLLMEKDGSVARKMNEQRTRTFSLSLLLKLTAAEVVTLESKRDCCLEKFATPPIREGNEKSDQESFVETCQLAYLELQGYATKSTIRRWGDMVALNVTGILKAMGLPREEQRRVRYYLKQLGLVRSHSKVDDGGHLWWWTVEKKTLDIDALRHLMEARPFEEAASPGATKAGPVTVRRISPETGILEQRDPSQKTTVEAEVKAVSDPLVEGDRMTALMAIVEKLAGDKAELERKIQGMESSHRAETGRLNSRIRELEQQLAQRATADTRADKLIAQFGSGQL